MKKSLAIIGGGPASMSLACFIDTVRYDVTIYEKSKALGRKFLVAGKGGFNLTHSLDPLVFKAKYHPKGFMDEAFDSFTNVDFRQWLRKIGIPTYVGSSGRVFPEKGIKPIEVLNAIIYEIRENKVKIVTEFLWNQNIEADIIVFALGGGSWSVTGSDGKWLRHFKQAKKFQAVNCAFSVKWPLAFITLNEGKPLKNIKLDFQGKSSLGELIITTFGLEGNAIYALSFEIQEALSNGPCTIFLDLKKEFTTEIILKKLKASKEKTISNRLKRDLRLDKTRIHLLQHMLSKEDYVNLNLLSERIKALPIEIIKSATVDEAISTIGGIPTDSLDQNFQMKEDKNRYCIGEMVDWHAPTGGFLLQACFSMGFHLAKHLNGKFGS